MFNLLRMDLYRLFRTKSVYLCLATLLAASVLSFWVMWLTSTPEGRKAITGLDASVTTDSNENDRGMVIISVQNESFPILEDYDILALFREIGMDGGAYACLLGIVVSIFVCHDYKSGFIKTILSLHRRRWHYIACKIITAGILNLLYLVISFGFCLLLNALFHDLVPLTDTDSILFYLSQSWVVTTAFAALFILIITLTRSTSAGVLASVLLGSGIIVILLLSLTQLWSWNSWADYTLYYNQTYMPSRYSTLHDLKGYAVGAGFLILYFAAAAGILTKKDI